MNEYQRQIDAAVRAVRITSPQSYTWFGHERVSGRVPSAASRKAILSDLQNDLYFNFYCLGWPVPSSPTGTLTPAVDSSLSSMLSRANAGEGYWQPGWTVEALDDRGLTVSRAGLRIEAPLDACRTTDQVTAAPGEVVQIRRSKELTGISPGFYSAVSNIDLPDGDQAPMLRLYLNLMTGAAAADFLGDASALLNWAGLPFRIKAAAHAAGYLRSDAVILYIRRSDFDPVQDLLWPVYSRLSAFLRPEVPALTRRLAPGLGLAEEPETGESFGQHRSRLIAEGLLRAATLGLTDSSDCQEVVTAHFRSLGLTVEAPYLNPGSVDDYGPIVARTSPATGRITSVPPGPTPNQLKTAIAEIGRDLAVTAIWADDACSWLGIAPGPIGGRDCVGLGPDLYLGTSGIALFLANAVRLGDHSLRTTALGAINHALSRAEAIEPRLRPGLHFGWIGIAVACARVGLALEQPGIIERGTDLALRGAVEPTGGGEFDVLAGRAGTILGLLCLHRLLGNAELLDRSIALGDELLRSAERSRSHIAWKSPDAPDQAALTGMSHGATGAALALAELFGECGERRFKEGAGLALAFESQCFWAEARNWQDFRGITQEVAFEAPRQFATSWCHGAPGIALARLRIHEIIGGDALLADARTGLATTGRHVQACIGQPGSHMGLCHGLSGNAEILLEGARTLVPEAQDRSVAEDAAAAIVQSLQSGELLNRLDGPGMMVGTAGVGLFLIRLIDPKVPSVLLVK